MSRIDLFVAPEQYPQVKALGACWDRQSKCWYIEQTMPRARFAAWLPEAHADGDDSEEFAIESQDAFLACASAPCRRCRQQIEIVCLYCRTGTVVEEPLEAFRVHCLWAVDDALRRQLQRWPCFRLDPREGMYLNHCPRCGAAQDETRLHEEPDQPFHGLGRDVPDSVILVPLAGCVRMSGDYSAEV
jgi:hypothetical protein